MFSLPLPTAETGKSLPYASVTGSVVVTSSDATSDGDNPGYFCKIIAAAPAT